MQQKWLFIENMQSSDISIGAIENENWCGFRSEKLPRELTPAEMDALVKEHADAGIRAYCLTIGPGDVLLFNGRWWHSTSVVEAEVLNCFYIQGSPMEQALKCHDRRFKLKAQSGLKMATINMAKCARVQREQAAEDSTLPKASK